MERLNVCSGHRPTLLSCISSRQHLSLPGLFAQGLNELYSFTVSGIRSWFGIGWDRVGFVHVLPWPGYTLWVLANIHTLLWGRPFDPARFRNAALFVIKLLQLYVLSTWLFHFNQGLIALVFPLLFIMHICMDNVLFFWVSPSSK